jgi:molecular chaperone DnaJ
MSPTVDLYEKLGVKSDASAGEIKKAYRSLAKKFHPDATGGDKAKERRFKEVSTAYDVLGNSDRRARYDAMRSGASPFGQGAPGAGGGFNGNVWDLGDLFAQMFGGAQGGGQPGSGGRGGGVRYRVRKTGTPGHASSPFDGFESFGQSPFAQKQRRPRRERAKTKPTGPTERKLTLADGVVVTQRGRHVYSDLRLALDEAILGTVKQVTTLSGVTKVKVPPGTSSGVKLRLKGKGANARNGKRGDHFVTIHIDVPSKIDDETEKLLAKLMRRIKSR